MPRIAKEKAPNGTSTATIGFEAKLWLTADKLRNNMDAAEYKHVVLGLIFLKYISAMSKPKRSTIEVQGTPTSILSQPGGDFISLTEMVRNFDGAGALIEQWLKNKATVLFLGVWERINNPGFNSLEFEGIRNEAGRNRFFP